jgi:DNA-binding NarL/FixJ family response regulator
MSTQQILVADDHEIVRRGTRELLESRGGFEVAEAKDGQEAVDKTRELKPDLVILDISMPLMDGFSAAREIRKNMPEMPILIVSLNRTDIFAEVARRIGASGYVTKGEGADILLAAVRAALNHEEFFPAPQSHSGDD